MARVRTALTALVAVAAAVSGAAPQAAGGNAVAVMENKHVQGAYIVELEENEVSLLLHGPSAPVSRTDHCLKRMTRYS